MTNARQESTAVPQVPEGLTENGRFDVATIAASFPDTAKALLVDQYLTYRTEASARVFRVYRPTPPHYHATCDEYLYVFSGRGTFWMEDPATEAEFKPGQLLFFARNTVHAMPKLFEHPVVFLSVDTPRRDPMDIIFVNPDEGSPQSFMARNAQG
ncbi:cupin domain-containing protein [Bradyrhizobium sp. AS23.2]|uniref:cupin domain-containing protein n=1 Tax=Bradyrhizobium sp. AS23.2 TaxID=1680155 RepID=UPI00093E74B2|nr:cupin domain-containing protein [Bradyrhizobium sp. AS23.2]OKO87436.1 cupin [Bradyrhizobium sp. AS23.2]